MSISFILYLVISVLNILYCLYKVDNWKLPTSIFIWNAIANLAILCIYMIAGKFESTEATWVVVVISANMGCWFGMLTSRS